MSLFDSTLAVGHGRDVSVAEIKFNPYSLDDALEFLPKPPSHTSTARSLNEVAMSLHFSEKNHLVVTYLDHSIV